jgi:hypothetical protein
VNPHACDDRTVRPGPDDESQFASGRGHEFEIAGLPDRENADGGLRLFANGQDVRSIYCEWPPQDSSRCRLKRDDSSGIRDREIYQAQALRHG